MAPSLTMGKCHLFAQKLNNSAALCIEIGHYDRAILSLTKALRLSREQNDESMMCGCSCYECSLDGCIAYSESVPPMGKHLPTPMGKDIGCGFVYQRTIRIPPLSILEKHNMGRTLFLIITFNLAMAYHLSAMDILACEDRSSNTNLQQTSGNKIKKALQLYEVCNNWHSRITSASMQRRNDCDTGASSIRFRIIISNNLSHIHNLGSNCIKQRQSLEYLLSNVMIAVEYKTRATSNNDTSPTESSSDNTNDLCTTNLEGFLMNASRLFLQESCAEAA